MVKSDTYAHKVYEVSRNIPKDEIYGLISQLRRAALSVPLNIIEGYAKKTPKYYTQHLRVAYGSVQESQYLLKFCVKEQYVAPSAVNETYRIGDEIAAMLWKAMQSLEAQR